MIFEAMIQIHKNNRVDEMKDFNEEAFTEEAIAKVTEALLSGHAYEFEFDVHDIVVSCQVSMMNCVAAAEYYLTVAHNKTFTRLLGEMMRKPTEFNVCALRQFYIQEMSVQIADNELMAYLDNQPCLN